MDIDDTMIQKRDANGCFQCFYPTKVWRAVTFHSFMVVFRTLSAPCLQRSVHAQSTWMSMRYMFSGVLSGRRNSAKTLIWTEILNPISKNGFLHIKLKLNVLFSSVQNLQLWFRTSNYTFTAGLWRCSNLVVHWSGCWCTLSWQGLSCLCRQRGRGIQEIEPGRDSLDPTLITSSEKSR